MFTGLIEGTGRVERVEGGAAGVVLRVQTPLAAELRPGDSIAVNGVCLTVTSQTADAFAADVSPQTLAVTSLGSLTSGRLVNLERPVRADARLGGHFVLGHVDGRGVLLSLAPDGDAHWLVVQIPEDLDAGVVARGSIALDGVSLTVATLSRDRIGVQIVPFTLAHTALADARAGDPVNIEVDVLGKYVGKLLAQYQGASPGVAGMGRQSS